MTDSTQTLLKTVVYPEISGFLKQCGYPIALGVATAVGQSMSYLDLISQGRLSAISVENGNLWAVAPCVASVFVINFSLLISLGLCIEGIRHYHNSGHCINQETIRKVTISAASMALISAAGTGNAIILNQLLPFAMAWVMKILMILGAVTLVMLPVRSLLALVSTFGLSVAPYLDAYKHKARSAQAAFKFVIEKLPPDVLSATAMASFNSYAWQSLIQHDQWGALLDALLTGAVSVLCFILAKLATKYANQAVRFCLEYVPTAEGTKNWLHQSYRYYFASHPYYSLPV